MIKKNLPHIPIYIGDWEKDCNCLSLEAEMAWMKIIFKMFTNGKESSYKIPTKSLQILWKNSPEKVQEIIDELMFNNISNISVNNEIVEFVCRRYKKENKISKIRSKAVSNRYVDKKDIQKGYKNLQNADNDIDNNNDIEYDNVIKNIVFEFYEFQSAKHKNQLNGWKDNNKLINDSCEVIDKLKRLDGFSYNDIMLVLRNVTKDEFWSNQIISLRGLRNKSKNGQMKFQNAAVKLLKKNVFDEWEERYGKD